MEREPRGRAAVDRHQVHVTVTVVLGCKREHPTIGTEARVRFRPIAGGEAVGNDRAAFRFAKCRRPKVAFAYKDELVAEQSGLAVIADLRCLDCAVADR